MKDGRKKGTPSGRTGLRRQSNKPRATAPPSKKTRKVSGDKSQWFRKAYEDSPIAIELFDARGLLLEVNRACLELFGVKDIEEIKGFELFEDPNISARVKKRLIAGETVRYEAPFDFGKVKKARLYRTRKSGVAHLDVLITPLRIGRKTINGYLVQVLDVTKRKKAEEALRKSGVRLEEKVAERTAELRREVAERRRAEAEISSVYNAISDYVTAVDTDYRIVSYNKIVEKQFGGNLKGRLCYEAYQARKDVCPGCAVKKCIASGKPEYTFQPATSVSRPVEIYAYPILDEEGRVTAVVEHGRDVTEKLGMHAERERLLHAVSSSSEGIAIADEQDRYLYVNEAHARIYGLRPEELLGKTWRELTPPEILEQTETAVRMTLHNPEVGEFHGEFPALRKDGITIPTEVRGRALRDDRGNYQGHICVVSDITARKEADEALRQSEKFLNTLIDGVADPIMVIGSDYKVKLMNRVARELAGVGRDLPEEPLCHRLSHHSDVPCSETGGNCPMAEVQRTGRPATVVHVHHAHEGEVRFVEIIASPLAGPDGSFAGIIESSRDITERKRAEELLKQSETKYRNLVELTSDIIYLTDSRGNPRFMNDAAYRMLEAAPEEVIGQPWDRWVHPEDRERTALKFREMVEKGTDVFNFESRYISKSGRVYTVLHNVRVLRNDDGEIVGAQGIARDITDRKQAEESLRLFSEALEEAPDGIQIVGLNGLIMYSNKAVQEIFGYHPEEIIGRHVDMMSVDTGFASRVVIPALQRTGRWAGEVMVRRKDGSEFPIWLTTSVVTNDAGEPIAMVGVSRDITERRKMEEEIKASNARLSALIQAIPDIVVFKDARGRHLVVNRACETAFGIRQEDVLGKTVEDMMPPELAAQCRRSDEEAMGSSSPVRSEEQGGEGDNLLYLDTIKSPIWGDKGEVEGLVVVSRDITERRKMEEALKGLNARLSALIQAIPDAVMFKDTRGRHLLINRACEEMFHFKKEDILGKTVEEFLPPALAALCRKSDDEAASAPAPVRTEENVGDGAEELWLDTIKSPILDEKGEVGGLVAVSRDITERKRMEDALKKSLEEKEMLIKEVHHRVKNNMALVTSLLSLQSRAVEDEGAKRLFIESTNRVRAMSAIHEQLYRSGEPSGIDFRDYVSRLVKDVVSSFERHPGIGLDLDIAEVRLDMDTVVPCALIINELVTNAYKHAFPDGRGGRLRTSFQPAGDGAYVLSVRDDGVGFPEGLDFRKATSMGMQIVTALAQQLGGDIELVRDGGTEFRITFPNRPNKKTPGGK